MKGTILYVGNFELPDKGASANRVVSNGKIFEKLGYRVVFLGVKKTETYEGVRCLDEERHLYEEAYPSGTKQWLHHIFSTKNIDCLMEQYGDVCMVILYNAPFSLLCRVKSAMKKRDVRVVYDCTEWTKDTEGSVLKRIVKGMDCHLVRRYLHKVADGLIVVSSRMKKAYQACGKVLLLPPLVDLSDSIWHQERKTESESFEFCFAGGLDGNKERLDYIVEAMSNLGEKKVLLRIIGVTEQEFCSFYPNGRELVEKSADCIQFMGRLSHAETIRHILGCDCYIFIREADLRNSAGFPTKFVEAYSCGVQVLTTDVSDVRNYQNERINLLQSVNVPKIGNAMLVAIQNKKLQERILDETFHYEKYVKACEEWITNI